MANVETVLKLQKKVKALEQEKERANGRMEQLMKTLLDEFDCKTLEEAEELLAEKEETLKQLEKEFDAKQKAFMKKWGKKLDNITG